MTQYTGGIATNPIASADEALGLLNAVTKQQKQHPADDIQFYEYGRILVNLLDTIRELALNLADHVGRYDEDRILLDALGKCPEERITDACTYLGEMHTAINMGKRHAHQYWSAISHISVEFDPNDSDDE